MPFPVANRQVDWLVERRLTPPEAPPSRIERPRLRAQLTAATERALSLVVAPAGSGKTTLVSDWARHHDARPVAWLTIDTGGVSVPELWDELSAAVERCGSETVAETIRREYVTDTGAGTAVRSLINAFARVPEPIVLIIDDIHRLVDQRAARELQFFVTHLPAPVHLVISGRREPPLALSPLRLRGDLTELRTDALRFSLEEVGELLLATGHHLAPDAIQALYASTEGWAAGVRLAIDALAVADDGARPAAPTAAAQALAGFVREELLAPLPRSTRQFLQRIAVADELCDDLASALVPHQVPAPALRDLADGNLLITPAPRGGNWYRMHPALAATLRDELQHEAPHEFTDLHLSASRWFAAAGDDAAALHHAVHAGDWGAAGAALGSAWVGRFLSGPTDPIPALLEQIPANERAAHPELAAPWAVVLSERGAHASASRHLALAAAEPGRVPAERQPGLDRMTATASMHLARMRGEVAESGDLARRLLGLPGAEDDPAIRSAAVTQIGVSQLWMSGADEAEPSLEDALRAAEHPSCDWTRLAALQAIANCFGTQGRLADAHEAATAAVELAARRGWSRSPAIAHACARLAMNHHLWGEVDEAEGWRARCGAAITAGADPIPPLALAAVDHAVAYSGGAYGPALRAARSVVHHLGRLRAAPWLSSAAHDDEIRSLLALGRTTEARDLLTTPPDPGRSADMAWARVHLAEGHPSEALAALEQATTARRNSQWLHLIDAALLEAIAHDQLGDHAASAQALEQALQLVEPERPVQRVLDGGRRVHALIVRQIQRGTAHRELIDDLLARSAGLRAASTTADPVHPAEPLTDRELAVLRYLPTAMSIPEVAAEMYLSPNTVRTHVKRVYRKLGVSQRREAIQRARELGLVGTAGSHARAARLEGRGRPRG